MGLSQLALSIAESPTLKLSEEARVLRAKGEAVINLGIGEPKNKTPEAAVARAMAVLEQGDVKYSSTDGTPGLKQAILRYTEENYGRKVTPANVIVSSGAKQSIFNLLYALLDAQDEVVLLAPYWVSYPEITRMCRGVPVVVTAADGGFRPTLAEVERAFTPRTKAVLCNSPNNPSGMMYDDAFLEGLVQLCERRDVHLVMDDIYHKLVFDGRKAPSAWSFTGRDVESTKIVLVNGVAKTYGMTGFRIGWAVASRELVSLMTNIQSQTTTCSSTVLQAGAEGALCGDQGVVETLRRTMQEHRDLVLQGLASIPGVRCERPDGTFYCLPDFSTRDRDSMRLSEFLLKHALVVTVPGREFGMEGHLRLSYAGARQDLVEAIARLKWALDPSTPAEIQIGQRRCVRNLGLGHGMPGHRRLVLPALLTLALAWAVFPAPAAAAPTTAPADATATPRNVILMIPDGCGPATVTLARLVAGRPLVLDSLLVGAVETHSADSHVTDSAAAATAYATGVKTSNRMLGVDPSERPLGTLLEAAAARGLATGLVTTADLTDATPAAFVAHVSRRALQDSIAVAMLEHHVDLLLGGGVSRWLPEAAGGSRRDGRDLLAEHRARGGAVVTDPAGLAAARTLPLLGLFGRHQLDLEIDRDTLREPSLAQMTAKALELLGPSPRGFFVMIEGGHIDDAGHDDDPAAVAREVLAYDRAVGLALAFARRDGRTLLVSAADHETGGLGLGRRVGRESPYVARPESLLAARASVWRMSDSVLAGGDPVAVAERGTGTAALDDDERAALRTAAGAADSVRRFGVLRALSEIESRRASVGWSTGGHTGVDVGLYAWGPGRERFAGLHENTEVSRLIAGLLGLDLDAETARLRGASAKPPRR